MNMIFHHLQSSYFKIFLRCKFIETFFTESFYLIFSKYVMEGRDYVVKDGDVLLFKVSV